MKRQKKFKSVNGVTFELKELNHDVDLEQIILSSKMLDECYNRPSYRKQAIFDSWWNWYSECDNIHGFGIRSYNTNIFTLQGYIEFNDYSYGVIDITPTHNYIYVKHLDMF